MNTSTGRYWSPDTNCFLFLKRSRIYKKCKLFWAKKEMYWYIVLWKDKHTMYLVNSVVQIELTTSG